MQKRILSLAILSVFLFFLADVAFAAFTMPTPTEAANTVGNSLAHEACTADGTCGDDIGTIVLAAMSHVKKLVNVVAVLIIVITGFILVTTQDEGHVSKAKNTLITSVIAMILINIAGPIKTALIEGVGSGATGGSDGARLITLEVFGIIDFIEEPLLIVAVLMIIISGIRAIIDFGSDQGITHIKRTIFSVIFGLVLLIFKVVLTRATAYTPEDESGMFGYFHSYNNANGIVELIVDITQIVVTFVALAAVTVIIIAGIIMVVNKGDQETATRSKNLIIRVLIGLFVILISYGLVSIFMSL